MIIKLQYKESESLYKQDKFMGDEWISLERENRMDFKGELRVARVGNRRDWVEERGTNR